MFVFIISGRIFLWVIDWCCFYYFVRNSLVALLEVRNCLVALLNRPIHFLMSAEFQSLCGRICQYTRVCKEVDIYNNLKLISQCLDTQRRTYSYAHSHAQHDNVWYPRAWLCVRVRLCVCVYVYVCECVCLSLCVGVWVCACVYLSVSVSVSVSVSAPVCIYVSVRLCVYIHTPSGVRASKIGGPFEKRDLQSFLHSQFNNKLTLRICTYFPTQTGVRASKIVADAREHICDPHLAPKERERERERASGRAREQGRDFFRFQGDREGGIEAKVSPSSTSYSPLRFIRVRAALVKTTFAFSLIYACTHVCTHTENLKWERIYVYPRTCTVHMRTNAHTHARTQT